MKDMVISLRRGVSLSDLPSRSSATLAGFVEQFDLVEVTEVMPTGKRLVVVGSETALEKLEAKLRQYCLIEPLAHGKTL